MGYLSRLLTGDLVAGTPSPGDDFWYRDNPGGPVTGSGQRVDPEGAKKISAWFRGRDLLATSLAMLPFGMNEKLPDDEGRDAADQHPLHDVIHRKPNPWQDAFQWKRQQMYHLIDFGNGYNRIVGGRRGMVDELWPIHPTKVKAELLETGRIGYKVRQTDGSYQSYTQDEIFHLRGACDDGAEGKGILQYARENLGLGLALDSYAARLFSQGVLHSGTITVPTVLDKDASKRMAESFVTSMTTWHLPKVLEQGATYQEASLTPEDSQFILSRKFTVTDIARWLGLPPHMLGDLERSTNNNIEQQGQEFVTYSLGLWLSLFEFSVNDQLVIRPDRFYAEFVRDALVRGDIATRWQAYVSSTNAGIRTRNEVRIKENLRKLPGLDTPIDPQNITGKPTEGGATPGAPAKKDPSNNGKGGRAEAIAVAAATRLLRTEVNFVQKTAVACADDADAFAAAVTDFYAKHAGFVQRSLLFSLEEAHRYCAGQASQIVSGNWVASVEKWQTVAYAEGLAALACDSGVEIDG